MRSFLSRPSVEASLSPCSFDLQGELVVLGRLSWDPARRSIRAWVFPVGMGLWSEHWDSGRWVECRIPSEASDAAVSEFVAALRWAVEDHSSVYIGARRGWSTDSWFCGIYNHSIDWAEAEESASPLYSLSHLI